jgi:hypothetical protein
VRVTDSERGDPTLARLAAAQILAPPPGKDLGENGGGARPSAPKKTQEAGGALSGAAVPGATSKPKPGRQCLRTKTEGGGTPQHKHTRRRDLGEPRTED